ncbi:hypothetical protein TWF102_006929 [Orbilia oligospora]|uniref:Uncharacterized protein n=1 Tax=Orbilia oligospora TaxID=2813651 RepID=A0A7C8NDW9_ORBOL|nr:hypothetical protein TWF103_005801 [Orbilia oligospora]KAF3111256.1 hypothetical protein TWF102_006929 [Orbilia oligospora]KAF3114245.1 hypothetical protein TWF706_008182 [Orbilia oligospora]
MYIPPEIILSIVDYLDCTPDSSTSDRATLIALRSANKDFYVVVTTVLFRDFSLHYGVSRSIPQMQGIALSSVIRPHVRSLFIPSESFFPLGKDVQFNTRDYYPWSRGSALDWLTVPDYSQALPVRKGSKGRPSHAKQTLMFHYPFREFPTKPWQGFSLRKKEFREQEQGYSTALSNLIEACENLEEIHIALGLGEDTARMLTFGKILGKHLMPQIVAKGIRKLVISVPSAHNISLPFTEYVETSNERFGHLPNFSSLESLVVESCYGSSAEPASKDFVALLDTLTGLNYFKLSLSSPMSQHSTKGISCYPISSTCHNLTTVKLSSLFLGENEDFLENFLSAVPTITDLVLYHIALPISSRLPENHSLLAKTWRSLFQHISSVLPRLTTFQFRHLMYGATPEPIWWNRDKKDVLLLLPKTVNNQQLTTLAWSLSLAGAELVSPFDEDLKGLRFLRKVVRERRIGQNLSIDAYNEDVPITMWAEGREQWTYLADE